MRKQLSIWASGIIARSGMPELLRRKKLKNHLITSLCLHRVSDEPSLSWPPLPVKVFEHLCEHWASHYHSTTYSELKEIKDIKKPLLILSFDDGYADFYESAWPFLKRYGLRTNMNIVTSCASFGNQIWTQRINNAFDLLWQKGIRKTIRLSNGSTIRKSSTKSQLVGEIAKLFWYLYALERGYREMVINEIIKNFEIEEIETPLMHWDQIIELSKEGVEIGCHTMTHDVLTTITNVSQLRDEIVTSKNIIEDKIGKRVSVLAFPNGFSNENINRIAFESGYEYLLSANNDLFSSGTLDKQKPLPRIIVHHTGYYQNVLNTENFFSGFSVFKNKVYGQ